MLTAQETVRKLIFYAEYKRRLHDPTMLEAGSPIANMAEARRLKKELSAAGVSSELLDLPGDEIAQLIHESLSKRGYV